MNEQLPEPLEDFLKTPPRANSSALRPSLLNETSRLVRRRRRARRLVIAGSLAASALIAAVTGWLLWPEARPSEAPPIRVAEKTEPAPPSSKPAIPLVPTMDTPKLPPALAKEWQAFDAPEPQKAALFMEAGDRYVEDHQDLASALRCYRQALDAADEPMLRINPNDNWLVTALKIDRRKEH
jgi:hypothetical protein